MRAWRPLLSKRLKRRCKKIKSHGMTTIIVEQNAVAALNLADRAIILEGGEVVFDGSAKEVLDNKEMRHEYLAI